MGLSFRGATVRPYDLSNPNAPKAEPQTIPNVFQTRSQNAAKTETGNHQKKHENNIRRRGAETSKTVVPFWHGAHLPTSADLKKIPEDAQINHTNGCETIKP